MNLRERFPIAGPLREKKPERKAAQIRRAIAAQALEAAEERKHHELQGWKFGVPGFEMSGSERDYWN
jgi:hypothetical protein